ncbi:NAC domain-containing protein 20-like [Lycium ferocissimum]|uniref:NAC domain-containing protein 20-like n=1 Tax=Lycium ferocissimum TaxID=112874 RepID=UPI00281560EA|nr:NAC domain-containing protein 20-like [Lycium ferocissimum]
MEKGYYYSNPTDKEIMNYLVRYVIGKRFPCKHKVVDYDDLYGVRAMCPWQIFEATEGTKNTRYLVTSPKRKRASWIHYLSFSLRANQGMWKYVAKFKEIFDDQRKLMGYVKTLRYFHREQSSWRKSEWLMREYYLIDKYLPPNKVKREDVIICMIKKKEQSNRKGYNPDDERQIIQSLQGLQLDNQDSVISNNVACCQGISNDKTEKQIIESLQDLQLQDPVLSHVAL